MLDKLIIPQCPDPAQAPACFVLAQESVAYTENQRWHALVDVAEQLYDAHYILHGLRVFRFEDQPRETQHVFLYAALAATGSVDQVRRDVARHAGIKAAEQTLALRFNVSPDRLKPADYDFCRHMADAAMDAQRCALEGITTQQRHVRAMVERIQALRPVQVEATVEPGGVTVTLDAEVL